MKNENFLRLRKPLTTLAEMVFKATGIRLDYMMDNRISNKFNPDNVEEMLSIYPSQILVPDLNEIRSVQSTFLSSLVDGVNVAWNPNTKGNDLVSTPKIMVTDEEVDEETELSELFQRDIIAFYNSDSVFNNIVLCIDKLYIDTIAHKLHVGAIEEEDLCDRVMKDIAPYVIRYIRTVPNIIPKFKQILKSTASNIPLGKMIDNSLLSADFNRVGMIKYTHYGDYTSFRNSEILRVSLVSLFLAELISDMCKGETRNIRNLDTTVSYIVREITKTTRAAKVLSIDMMLRNILGKNCKGSAFDMMLSLIVNDTATNVEEGESYKAMRQVFLGVDVHGEYRNCDGEKVTKKILDSKILLKYAESCDILCALMDIRKENLVVYRESIMKNEDDVEKELSQVIEMSRRASLAKVDMEYVSTVYSKKDALKNAYIVLQEIRAAKRKLKTEIAIDRMGIVEEILFNDIKECERFDHKKQRMTINIAYPTGYEG